MTRFYVYIMFVSLFGVCLLLFVNIHRSDVLTALTWLVPHENCCRLGAFCVHYTTTHHVTSCKLSHIRKVHACLAVTYHLHFCQNDRSFTCYCDNTGVERQPKRVNTERSVNRRTFSRRCSTDSNPRPFNHEPGALTTELSALPKHFP